VRGHVGQPLGIGEIFSELENDHHWAVTNHCRVFQFIM
jgi:hypothetical protein